MAQYEAGTIIRTKKKCCNSAPRCKKCPVVWRRLARAGLVERVQGREFRVVAKVRTKDLKRARCDR
jgi:hypothetical protein